MMGLSILNPIIFKSNSIEMSVADLTGKSLSLKALNVESGLTLQGTSLYPGIGTYPPMYGSFYNNLTQGFSVGENEMILRDSYLTMNYIVPDGAFPTTKLRVLSAGTYKITASIQVDKEAGGGTSAQLDVYLRINNQNVPNSATKYEVANSFEIATFIEYFVDLQKDDTFGIVVYASSDKLRALGVAEALPVPAIPSIILNVYRIA